jgi:putative DNA primase/helicase
MSDPIEHFRLAIAAAGLDAPDSINADGAIHRFSTNGKPRDDSGYYVLHTDGIAAGAFGCWRTGLQSSWCAKSDNAMTDAERDAHRQRSKAMKAQREADLLATQQQASQTAAALWQEAAQAPAAHEYLTRKRIKPHGAKFDGHRLMIPMRDTAGTLHSLQTIAPDGDKRFMPGGRVKGCYHAIGKPDGVLIVCEGYATGASIHEATGDAVAVAFNAGNLEAVALALRAKYPALKIIVAADDDHLTDGNPGMSKATAAALAVGGLVAVPSFPTSENGRPDKATDFNDLYLLAGADAVKACIDSAINSIAAYARSDWATGINDAWPELQPLIVQIDPQDYPLDALPDAVRCAVQEVADFVKAPIPLIATSALAALSLAIQGHTDVERAEKLSGPCGLFLLAIADSGERKSTCDGFFTTAIRDYQAQQKEAAKPLIQAYKSEHDAWEAQRSGLKEKIKQLAKDGKPSTAQVQQLHDLDADEPTAPRVPRLIYGDATPEALTYALAKHWPSGGVISSEAGSVFGGHGMGGDSVMRNLAALNQLWDGATLPVERRSSESFTVRGARLTMALQVQEATIRAFFESTKGLARGTGFLARFLVSWPQSTQGTRHFTEAPANWPALAAFNNRLTAILNRPAPIDDDGGLSPAMLTLAPDAKAAWVAFHNAIESELSTGRELYDVRDVASKTADNAARLAALFHTFTGGIGPIDIEAMEAAARVTLWHLTEAKRFLGELAMPAELANPTRLESWMLDYCRRENTDKVPTREVQRGGPGGLRDKKTCLDAVKGLAELGRARLVQDGKKKLIQINPALLAGAGS